MSTKGIESCKTEEKNLPIAEEQEKHLNIWEESPFSLVIVLKYCNLSSVSHDSVPVPWKYLIIARIFYKKSNTYLNTYLYILLYRFYAD